MKIIILIVVVVLVTRYVMAFANYLYWRGYDRDCKSDYRFGAEDSFWPFTTPGWMKSALKRLEKKPK